MSEATNGHVNGNFNSVYNAEEKRLVQLHLERVENEQRIWRQLFNSELYFDPRRDISQECGYPDTTQLTPIDYKRIFIRDPIASQVVSLYPDDCWQLSPEVYESEDIDDVTPFEDALEQVGKDLQGSSFFEDDEGIGNILWWYLWQADIAMGIGCYGALLIGVDDGKELDQPLVLKEEGYPTVKRKITYLRFLDESQCEAATWVTDKKDKRFGQPLTYNVTMLSVDVTIRAMGVLPSTTTANVHWTRIVHLSEGIITHDPRMLVVYDRLHDLRKAYGSSAEGLWKAAFQGISFETDKSLFGKRIDKTGMKDMVEKYDNGLQRWMVPAPGMSAKTLPPTLTDPSPVIERNLEAICIKLKCPKRKFMGSEIGELASSQDVRSWFAQVKGRNNKVTTPKVCVPVITRFIHIGILPAPERFCISWPDIANLTDLEKAQIAFQRMQVYSTYVAGGVEALMEPKDMYVREMGYSEEEAQEILDNRTDAVAAGTLDEIMGTDQATQTETNLKLAQQYPPPTPPGQAKSAKVANEDVQNVRRRDVFGGTIGTSTAHIHHALTWADRPMTVQQVARIVGVGVGGARHRLNHLASLGAVERIGSQYQLRQDIRDKARASIPANSITGISEETRSRTASARDRARERRGGRESVADCGANHEGGGGFQPGNTCARGSAEGRSASTFTDRDRERFARRRMERAMRANQPVTLASAQRQALDNEIDQVRFSSDTRESSRRLNTWQNINSSRSAYYFKTGTGREFHISTTNFETRLDEQPIKYVGVMFADDHGSCSMTNRGEAVQVFRKVAPAVTALVRRSQPDVIEFSASGASRVRLYDRLTQSIAATSPDYFAVAKGDHESAYYYIMKRDKREALLAKYGRSHYSSESVRMLVNAAGDDLPPGWEELEPFIDERWFEEEAWPDLDDVGGHDFPKDGEPVQNTFEGHAGRPGHQGGSVPSGANGVKASDRPKMKGKKVLSVYPDGSWVIWSSFSPSSLSIAKGSKDDIIPNKFIANSFEGHAGRPGERGGSVPKGETNAPSSKLKIVDTWDQVSTTKMGQGALLLKDGRLIDVTSEFGGGTNDHVGIFTLMENPADFGVDAKTAKAMKKLDDEMNRISTDPKSTIDERADIDSRHGSMASDALDKLINKQSAVRVRMFNNQPNLDVGNIKPAKVVDYILAGKLPKSDYYYIESFDHGLSGTISFNDLAEVNTWKAASRRIVENVEGELLHNSFPDHAGRPGQVGGSQPLGEGTKKLVEKVGLSTTDRTGRIRHSPRTEAEGVVSQGYVAAAKSIKDVEATIKQTSKLVKAAETPQEKLSHLNMLGMKYGQASQYHQLASSLVTDADQVKYHAMRSKMYEKKQNAASEEYFATRKKMFEE